MINIDYDKITDIDTAKDIIRKLVRGMNECPSATFSTCSGCGEIITDGWICPFCSYDNSNIGKVIE